MAILTGNPWRITAASGTAVTLDRVRILGFRWMGATMPGHVVVITDGAGTVIWESEAAGDNYTESDSFPVARIYKGLIVPTLDSGRLYVEVG